MIALCSLLLAGCGVPFVGNLTPEQAAAQMHRSPDGKPQPVTTLGQRALPSGNRVVIYRSKEATPPDGKVMDWLGYAEVERSGLGWQPRSGGAQTVDAAPVGTFVQYGTGSNGGEPNSPVFVYGERLVPEVLAVEATFDNGQTVRDGTADGIFVLATTNAHTLCEIRVLGENDTILRTISDQQPVAFAANGPLPSRCQ
jgi:hypothetical protein